MEVDSMNMLFCAVLCALSTRPGADTMMRSLICLHAAV